MIIPGSMLAKKMPPHAPIVYITFGFVVVLFAMRTSALVARRSICLALYFTRCLRRLLRFFAPTCHCRVLNYCLLCARTRPAPPPASVFSLPPTPPPIPPPSPSLPASASPFARYLLELHRFFIYIFWGLFWATVVGFEQYPTQSVFDLTGMHDESAAMFSGNSGGAAGQKAPKGGKRRPSSKKVE